jgi:hypothetical protein
MDENLKLLKPCALSCRKILSKYIIIKNDIPRRIFSIYNCPQIINESMKKEDIQIEPVNNQVVEIIRYVLRL